MEPCITIIKRDGTVEKGVYVSARRLPLPWQSEFFVEEFNRFLTPEEADMFFSGKTIAEINSGVEQTPQSPQPSKDEDVHGRVAAEAILNDFINSPDLD